MARAFSLTYDYLCPFARIANETVVEALQDGADWVVEFVPFSLSETKVREGEDSVWDRQAGSAGTRGVKAHYWALAARSMSPERFFDFHVALFEARHHQGRDVDDESVLREVAKSVGLDAGQISDLVASGEPAAELARRHTEAVKLHSVFGVPTFILGDEAVFVRFLRKSRADIDRVLDMLEWSNLNEFKRTTIPR